MKKAYRLIATEYKGKTRAVYTKLTEPEIRLLTKKEVDSLVFTQGSFEYDNPQHFAFNLPLNTDAFLFEVGRITKYTEPQVKPMAGLTVLPTIKEDNENE